MEFERANTPVGVHSPSTHSLIFYLAFAVHKELRRLVVQQHMHGGHRLSRRRVSHVLCFLHLLVCPNCTLQTNSSRLTWQHYCKSKSKLLTRKWLKGKSFFKIHESFDVSRNGRSAWWAAVLLCLVLSTLKVNLRKQFPTCIVCLHDSCWTGAGEWCCCHTTDRIFFPTVGSDLLRKSLFRYWILQMSNSFFFFKEDKVH